MKAAMIFVLLAVVVHSIDDGDFYEDIRKHYGLSFNNNCKSYVKVFKCMTACKSIGFQVFRVDFKCKCRCHEMKTSTVLPFFKWRTNGTTRKVPITNSPRLYSVVGTASPQEPTTVDETETEEPSTLPICVTVTSTADENETVDANSTTTVASDSSNSTGEETTPSDKEGETTAAADGDAATTAGGTDGGDGADDAATTVAPSDDAAPDADAPTEAPPEEPAAE